MRLVTCAALIIVGAFSAACSTESDVLLQTARATLLPDFAVDQTPLNPNFRYLRVTTRQGRRALLVLGYIDEHPAGPIEVWYSGERETLRLQNGRLVAATGMPIEWRNVNLPSLPAWSDVHASNGPYRWVRSRDVMPGYRYGVQDVLTLHPIESPAFSAIRGLQPQRLLWFQERNELFESAPLAMLGGTLTPEVALPPARYAVMRDGAGGVVVYAEQCLTSDFCITWQRWPPEGHGTTR